MPEAQQLDRMEEKLDKVLGWIHGTGDSPGANVRISTLENNYVPDAKVRLDRLEQESASRKAQAGRRDAWLIGMFGGVGVTVVLAVWSLVNSAAAMAHATMPKP